ncbi:MAG: type II toxin-antitoxin system Phd/YefM family antitoxin [Caulobacteraceae bacterium]
MKTVTITEFRKNLFHMVDEALATGEPIEIKRKGGRVVLRGERESEIERRAEKFDRFMARPTPPGWEGADLSVEALSAGEPYWVWDEEPEPDA